MPYQTQTILRLSSSFCDRDTPQCLRYAPMTTACRFTRGVTAQISRLGAWRTCWRSTTCSSRASRGRRSPTKLLRVHTIETPLCGHTTPPRWDAGSFPSGGYGIFIPTSNTPFNRIIFTCSTYYFRSWENGAVRPIFNVYRSSSQDCRRKTAASVAVVIWLFR